MEKYKTPEDPTLAFEAMVLTMSKHMGMDKIASIKMHVDMLSQACISHYGRGKGGSSLKKKNDVGLFISIWNARYLQMADFEYTRVFSPLDAKLIVALCEKLDSIKFTMEEFLAWMYEDFLPDNEKFCPPTVKTACSDFIFEQFRFSNKAEVAKRTTVERQKAKVDNIAERCRILMRQYIEKGNGEAKALIREKLLGFKEGRVTLDALSAFVLEREQEDLT